MSKTNSNTGARQAKVASRKIVEPKTMRVDGRTGKARMVRL